MPLSLVTSLAPVEPLSLEQAKRQCRIDEDITHDDALLEEQFIPAARQRGEERTQRQFLTATYDLFLDAFPAGDVISVPKPPLASVTWVKYLDSAGTLRTLVADTDYVVDAPSGPLAKRGRIALAYGKTWPATLPQINAVRIRFQCGYGADGTYLPPLLFQALAMDVAALYEHRGDAEAAIPDTADRIYKRFRDHGE